MTSMISRFRGKSRVTMLVCCVWCVHGCVVRDEGKRERDVYTHLRKFVLGCMRFALCVPITCEYGYNLCGCIGVWVVRVLEYTFIYSRQPLLLADTSGPLLAGNGPLLKDFAIHLKHSRLRKVTFVRCTLSSVDVATLFAEGLSENRILEHLHISLWMATISQTVRL